MSVASPNKGPVASDAVERTASEAARPAISPRPPASRDAAVAWEIRDLQSWAAAPRESRARARRPPSVPPPTFEQALRTSEELADLSRAEPARALRLAHAFVEMARRSESAGAGPIVAVARRCRGHVHRRLGRYREALRDYDAARRDFAALGDALEAARTDIGAVDALGHMGRDSEARRMAQRARVVFSRAGEGGRVARLDVNLALIAERSGRPRDALAAYRRAEAMFERLDARTDLALTRFNHANALVSLDRYREALDLYHQSAEVWRERGATSTLCRCQLAAGSVLFRLGRLGEALALLEETRDAAASLGDPELTATAALDLARVEMLADRLDAVEGRLDAAIRGFEALAMPADLAESLGLRGTLRLRTARPEESLADWNRARAIYRTLGHRRGGALADFWRAAALARLGRASESRALLRAALRTLRAEGPAIWEAESRLLLAEQEIARRPREAARQLSLVAQRSRALRDPWIAYRLAVARARLSLRAGTPRAAKRCLEHAYAVARRLQAVLPLESLQAEWMAKGGDLFDLAFGPSPREEGGAGAVRRRDGRWLLLWSERARAPRSGGAQASAAAAAVRSQDPAALADPDRAAFDAVRQELHWLDTRERARRFTADSHDRAAGSTRGLDRWRRRRAEAMSRLERHTRRLEIRAAARGRGWCYAEPDPAAIQGALASDEALIEYFVREEELIAIVATPRAIEAVTATAGLDEAREAAHRLRQLWHRHRPGAGFSLRHEGTLAATAGLLLEQLRAALLDPVMGHVPADARRLVVSPHGWLRGVPFHAFPGAGGAIGDLRDVRYTLSGQWLAEAPPEGRARGPALVVGLSSPDAPGAEAESRAVARRHATSTLLVGDAATPAAVRARWPDARIIHIAAHGGIQTDDARLSGLPLAGGTWTVHEIRGVDTRADLVVLSSCQSGESVLWSDTHHVGLLPALFESGARAAVVSLWPADDTAARIFMTSFHHEIFSGRSIGEALQAARNVIRSVKPSPYYWAPFVLYGADRRRRVPS